MMSRDQLEHLIRTAATISEDHEIVVIGSQAMLGWYPEAPPDLCQSADADLFPRNRPERADLIDGSIGELSPFHETYGYYAQGVGPRTAVLPSGWEERLVRVETEAGTGLCLEPHDLIISKYAAARDKDRDYVRAALSHGLVEEATLLERLDHTPLDAEQREHLRKTIQADAADAR